MVPSLCWWRMFGRGFTVKHPVSLLSVVTKIFGKLVNRLHIFSIASVLAFQLQIFWQLHQIELSELLICLGLLVLSPWYDRGFDRVWDADFLQQSKFYGISGRVFCPFRHYSAIDGLQCWTVSLSKNILLMLVFLKAQFLILRFFCYTLMTLLLAPDAILLFMKMKIVSTLNEIRFLNCVN